MTLATTKLMLISGCKWTFTIPELYRILKPGRMACIHVKDRLLYGHQTPHGMMEVDPFSDDCNRAFRKHGFVSYSRITIPTDVVRENNSTNQLGWSENYKDGSKMGVGMPEYVLLFRKPQTDKTRSYTDQPVRKDKKRVFKRTLANRRSSNLAFQWPCTDPGG